jgi:hypothetical protein
MLPTFPNFASLKLEDKEAYDQLVSEYPPFSDISFATLHIWWNLEGKLSLSILNKNLVINYHLPFDPKNSGLCIVGKNSLDTCIEEIFEYLRKEHRAVKLVHVPEFVVENIRNKSNLTIEEETDYNEYILDSKALSSLEGPEHGRTRRKVKRFLREVEESKVEIKSLDLSSPEVKTELFEAVLEWEKAQPNENDPEHTEHQALKNSLTHSELLEIKYLGLYVDDKLHAIILYHQPKDKKYYIIHHLKVDYSIPYIFDYMTHHIANKAVQEDVDFINMEMDLGLENLKQHKMGLRPIDFFRKYTIKPT